MNTTEKYLEAIKAKTGLQSDYALAKLIGITRQQMSNYRNRGEQFGGNTALKVASILEIDPIIVLSDIQADKAKTDNERAVWKGLIERLGGVAATLLLATGINALQPAPVLASEATGEPMSNIHYAKCYA